jgi:hypothetical protein
MGAYYMMALLAPSKFAAAHLSTTASCQSLMASIVGRPKELYKPWLVLSYRNWRALSDHLTLLRKLRTMIRGYIWPTTTIIMDKGTVADREDGSHLKRKVKWLGPKW